MLLRVPRATPLPPDERRAALIAATEPLLERFGRDVSTRQIAEAAGVAEGTIFRVFPTKEALIDAVLEEVFDVAAHLRRAAPRSTATSTCETRLAQAVDHPAAPAAPGLRPVPRPAARPAGRHDVDDIRAAPARRQRPAQRRDRPS